MHPAGMFACSEGILQRREKIFFPVNMLLSVVNVCVSGKCTEVDNLQ